MTGIVVSDASPLHYLILVGAVDFLPRLFSEVIIPSAVAAELTHSNTPHLVSRWAGQPPSWLKIVRPQAVESIAQFGCRRDGSHFTWLSNSARVDSILIDERKGRLSRRPTWPLYLLAHHCPFGALLHAKTGLTSIRPLHNWRAAKFRLNERLITEAKKRLEDTK